MKDASLRTGGGRSGCGVCRQLNHSGRDFHDAVIAKAKAQGVRLLADMLRSELSAQHGLDVSPSLFSFHIRHCTNARR